MLATVLDEDTVSDVKHAQTYNTVLLLGKRLDLKGKNTDFLDA